MNPLGEPINDNKDSRESIRAWKVSHEIHGEVLPDVRRYQNGLQETSALARNGFHLLIGTAVADKRLDIFEHICPLKIGTKTMERFLNVKVARERGGVMLM